MTSPLKLLNDFLLFCLIDSEMPCIKNPESLITEIEARLKVPNIPDHSKRNEMAELAERIVKASLNSFYTNQYDNF